MIWLKQSTAVVISMGPFVLNSDGVTLVVNLVGTGSNQTENTSTGIRIAKNGGAFAARHATASASTYDAFGNYLVTLDTTDTGTLGVLRMQFANGAAFCPVWMDFMVVPANVWDSMFGADNLDVSVIQWLGTAVAAATAGIPDTNAKNINNVATTSVTAVNANVGTTQPINFTGTGASALAKSDMVDVAGAAVSTSTAQLGVNAVNIGGTAAASATVGTVTNLTNAPTAGDLTATMKTSVQTATAAALTAFFTSAAQLVSDIWNAATRVLTAATNLTTALATPTNITAGTITTVTNLTNAPTAGDFTATMKTSLNAATPVVTVSDKTGFSLTLAYDAAKTAAQAGNAMTLTSVERTSIADATLARTLAAESYAADGAVPTLSQALYMILQIGGEFSISGTTITVKKLDGSTTAMTFTLDSSVDPITSRTRAT